MQYYKRQKRNKVICDCAMLFGAIAFACGVAVYLCLVWPYVA